MGDPSGAKAIENHIKHEKIVDAVVKVLNDAGIEAKPTEGHNPKGDIQIPADKIEESQQVIQDCRKSNRDKK